jgi:hypothetical protein
MPSTFTVPTTISGKTVGRLVINYVSGICYDAYLGAFLLTPLSENERPSINPRKPESSISRHANVGSVLIRFRLGF